MLSPSVVNINSFFYPIGSTSATCLTQDLTPEQKAHILLLGCGDARDVLFTAYSDNGINKRQVDITCCDIEQAIIARNVFLYTLLIDDVKGANNEPIWDVYYHLFLNDRAAEMLKAHSNTLCALATSLDIWHASKYGKVLRFCDAGSLKRVQDVWSSYDILSLSVSAKTDFEQSFRAGIQDTIDWQRKSLGHGLALTGFRSAAPASDASIFDLAEMFRHYWDHGTTDTVDESPLKHSNPTFASRITNQFTLYYGSNPLIGFHLALAYIPLTQASPLAVTTTQKHKAVQAAREEFSNWAIAFRKSASQNLTLRFFVGDALGFCHTLNHRRVTGSATSAHWYRGMYGLDPLVLDGIDYNATAKAPLSFNIIDTSSLADDVGALNVLIAASPLLQDGPSSTLYMESLLQQSNDRTALMDVLLCGHLSTMSVLLGLFPIEYWTNASPISTHDDSIMPCFPLGGTVPHDGQMRQRIIWKRPFSDAVDATQAADNDHWHENELAHVLHKVYHQMFRHEFVTPSFLTLNPLVPSPAILVLPHYHRGSFASLLHLVKNRVDTNWPATMESLFQLIETDYSIRFRHSYMQDLYLHLHNFGVHYVPGLKEPSGQVSKGGLKWDEMGAVVCVTLKVPRIWLRVFNNITPKMLGRPMVHGILQTRGSSGQTQWQHLFANVQLAFGKIVTSGSRHVSDFRVEVVEDSSGWLGTSPLIVSFCVPRWMTLLDQRNILAGFGLMDTAHNITIFDERDMRIFNARLDDEDHVYITNLPPSQDGYPLLSSSAVQHSDAVVRTSIAVNINMAQSTSELQSLVGRVRLSGTVAIKISQDSPCVLKVRLGSGSYRLFFPTPVKYSQTKLRIAGESLQIKVPVADLISSFPNFMYPLFLHEKVPIVWNLPYLNLDLLPIIDTAKAKELDWFKTHIAVQFSARELKLRKSYEKAGPYAPNDARVGLKDSIFHMFQLIATEGARIITIDNEASGGIQLIFFVSRLRINLGAQSVVLDAAVIQPHKNMTPRLEKFLRSALELRGIILQLRADDEELRLWKMVIPAMVERCRRWEHGPSCEYIQQSRIPLSLEKGDSLLCSCGNGSLPPDFITGVAGWDTVAEYAARVAISPSFSWEFVEEISRRQFANRALDLAEPTPTCWKCGQEMASSGLALLRCSRCMIARYCSKECQRADWKNHKEVCETSDK